MVLIHFSWLKISMFNIVEKLKNKLPEIEHTIGYLTSQFITCDQEINYIFLQIKKSEQFESAHNYFDLLIVMQTNLERIQSKLEKLVLREGIGTPNERLQRFIKDFKEIKNTSFQENIFIMIKNDVYNF